MLYGEILKEPKLRFDYSSNFSIDMYPKRGLKTFGPYDSKLFPKEKINCVLLYPHHLENVKEILKEGLQKGDGSFLGFKSLFKIQLEFIEELKFSEVDVSHTNIIIDSLSTENIDLGYVLLQRRNAEIYKIIKNRLLANGIPSQMITFEKLSDRHARPFILENISLASYAKVGGTPWTISTNDSKNQLILGISRAKDSTNRYLVGFVTVFTQEGDYLFMNSKTPVTEWDKYVEGLSSSIKEAIIEFSKLEGEPDTIILHFHKTPGKKEIEAIESVLKNVARDIPYALIHLNEYSNFRLFDSSDRTYIPPKGLKVNVSSHEALLLLDGRIGEKHYNIGLPRILDIKMDKRSKLTPEIFPDLVRQIYDFSHINWRGFNASATPITLDYSKLIARMVIEIGIEKWNEIIAQGKLRNKAWFL